MLDREHVKRSGGTGERSVGGQSSLGLSSFVLDCGSAPLSMVTNSRQLFFRRRSLSIGLSFPADKSISTRSRVEERIRGGPIHKRKVFSPWFVGMKFECMQVTLFKTAINGVKFGEKFLKLS